MGSPPLAGRRAGSPQDAVPRGSAGPGRSGAGREGSGRDGSGREGAPRRGGALTGYGSRAARLPWLLAALLVPLLLAAAATAWSGAAIEHDLAARSSAALAAAGLPGTVAIDGRDATISGVPAGQRQRALAAVSAVDGVRVARIGAMDAEAGRRPAPVPDGAPGAAGAVSAEAGAGPGPGSGRGSGPVRNGDAAGGAPAEAGSRAAGERAAGERAAGERAAGDRAAGVRAGLRPDRRVRPQGVDRAEFSAALAALPPITFRPDSVLLTPQGSASVRLAGELLLAAPGVRVELGGHVAVAPGGAANALLLSERRAAAVLDALVAAGVPAGRLVPLGYGDTRPLPDPAASRRVEITVR